MSNVAWSWAKNKTKKSIFTENICISANFVLMCVCTVVCRYVCMYLCLYVNMYVFLCKCTNVCLFAHMYAVCINAYGIYMYIYVFMYGIYAMFICTVYIYVPVCIFVCMHICTVWTVSMYLPYLSESVYVVMYVDMSVSLHLCMFYACMDVRYLCKYLCIYLWMYRNMYYLKLRDMELLGGSFWRRACLNSRQTKKLCSNLQSKLFCLKYRSL
jgi:hypothetical protein